MFSPPPVPHFHTPHEPRQMLIVCHAASSRLPFPSAYRQCQAQPTSESRHPRSASLSYLFPRVHMWGVRRENLRDLLKPIQRPALSVPCWDSYHSTTSRRGSSSPSCDW